MKELLALFCSFFVNLIKKSLTTRFREKAVIADALKTKYPLPVLLKKLRMAKSSYYYQKKRFCFAEKHKDD